MTPPIKCLIVDDEPLAIELIKKHIEQLPQLELIGSCWNALEAFEVLKTEPVDLLFLDIQMPMLTGIEFVKSLQRPPSIIFTTAYREYAVESYELDVVDYLLKPITFTRFFKAINKYLNRTFEPAKLKAKHKEPDAVKTDDFIYVNTNRRHVKVAFRDVLYIESIKDYIRINTVQERITTKEKISDFEKRVPQYFLRIHRSFIINTQKVTAFTANDIEIGEQEIPIGISYKKEVLRFFRT